MFGGAPDPRAKARGAEDDSGIAGQARAAPVVGAAAAARRAMTSFATREAPPTRPPSTSASAKRPGALAGDTEPPYRIRVKAAAPGPNRAAISARRRAWTSAAIDGVAGREVPIAQTGS